MQGQKVRSNSGSSSFCNRIPKKVIQHPGASSADIPAENKRVFSPREILEGVRADFIERNYLWTGKLTTELYEDSCTFRDPTISFTGIDTHQRNIATLTWFTDRLVGECRSELLSCELDEPGEQVVARWRMQGSFKLPWKPMLDCEGMTRFVYSPESGNRIVSYDEEWTEPAIDILKQLITPA